MSEIYRPNLLDPLPPLTPQQVRDAQIQLAEAAITLGDEGGLGDVLDMMGVR